MYLNVVAKIRFCFGKTKTMLQRYPSIHYLFIYELNNFRLLVYNINQPINLMEASLCCHKYHGKETPTEPTCPTTGPTHLTAKPSLANDSHIFFLYIL